MTDSDYIIDDKGNWRPAKKLEFDPIFVWPPRPIQFLKYLFSFPGYIWPWNIFYIAIAVIIYLFFQPAISECKNFSFSWISIVFLRNLFLVFVYAGLMHLRFYIFKYQGEKYQYNTKPLGTGNKFWHFGSQTRENMFWTLCSAVPIWSAYEVIFLWGYANNIFPYIDFNTNPIYFCVLFLLLPGWQMVHFYFSHRITHWKPLYKWVHYLHHRNVNTGPWSGLSMHPVEHIIYFSTVLIHFIIPSHPLHMIFHIQRTGLAAIHGHSGFDKIMLNKHRAKLPHASYFHYLHHKYFECNYGELWMPLDKWFGSFHNGSKEDDERLVNK
ncbi:MAG: hypothetical protein CFH16_00235 [Alphaproteobacteria bacterium MarineAlpha5_Bin6]|mgnify:CR=1 FL=1|nr:MAG: hypothetical protein CFH17_00587 [Alphaproteobacteria bacterium MarineAlpha5_Bin7]PPR54652.1 MAG: hypothetical protein CFH16_00235 [Alphaproteobacteria bacterium MarineAlpha5_Bin6]|tara:strand:- start:687 stop:1661 length:975 start_codon:yes stop_codon:yes gene_type:complete